jgi:uncharacterized protein YecE (DUF72 family)
MSNYRVDFPRDQLASDVADLARKGVLIGTSSWKYEGWLGLLYTRDRYLTRGRLSHAKFRDTCLAEYAEVFKTVCFDGGLYQFPKAEMLKSYLSQVPDDFQMSIKVTEDITVRKFPKIPRNVALNRAGKMNENFLNFPIFEELFLALLEPYQKKIGTLIFSFSTFKDGWESGEPFFEVLDSFFGQLPKGWNYSVEVRNRSFLQPAYFEVLRRHGVSHTFNSWMDMPPVSEQLQVEESFTADFSTARFLLKPGRDYNEAVDTFEPYAEIKDPYPEARAALIDLLLTPAKPGRPNRRFLYVNNRLEGCALWTIYAAISGLLRRKMPDVSAPPVFRLE